MSANGNLSPYNKLLIVAFVISPFTVLRIYFFGFAELVFVVAFLREIKNPIKSNFIFSRFWLIYLFISLIGLLYNNVLLPDPTGNTIGMLFDLSAYLLVFASCFTMETLISRDKVNPNIFLNYIFIYASSLMSVLYIISFFSPTILGLPLFYERYFSPLANNIHQISMSLVPLPFIGLNLLTKENKIWFNLFVIILIAIDIQMAFSTGATKAYISIYVGALCYLLLITLARHKYIFSILLASTITLIVIELDSIINIAMNAFVENDLKGGRDFLYRQALELGYESILFGRGVGPHILDAGEYRDSHQTFLTTFLQTGLIGTTLTVLLFLKIFYKKINSPSVFAAVVAIFMYAAGGDIMRRMPMWIFLVLLYNHQDNACDKSILFRQLKMSS